MKWVVIWSGDYDGSMDHAFIEAATEESAIRQAQKIIGSGAYQALLLRTDHEPVSVPLP